MVPVVAAAYLDRDDTRRGITFSTIIDTLDVGMRVYMRARGRLMPYRAGQTFFGARIRCDTRDFIQRRISYFGIYEPNLTYYVMERVGPGEHALDVGANIGYVTLLLSSIVGPEGKVVSIEACPSTYEKLKDNLEANSATNVVALNMAATGGPCMVAIVPGERNNSGSNSIRAGDGTASVPGDALSNITTIDRAQVSFIKIDVEGSEAPVLRDICEQIGLFPKLRTIAVELSPGSDETFARLQAAGFRAFAFPNNYSIGYLVVREYLRRSQEHGFVVKHPLGSYDPKFRDYVFERTVG